MPSARILATYRVRSDPAEIDARAQAIALEQSVELPLAAVTDARVRDEVVGTVIAVRRIEERLFDVDIGLAEETIGADAGQLMNMLFGNTSLQEDVALVDVEMSDALAAAFGGPRFGIEGLRVLTGVRDRPLACTALKPQGMDAQALARLAATFARAGIDVIKDDHGLADQSAAPFAARVSACQRAVEEANAAAGKQVLYAPSVTGDVDAMRRQLDVARSCGARAALVAPMVCGPANFALLARECAMVLIAHPALAGAARIAAPLLLGKLFRLFGADATIFPNAGGRFGYSIEECRAIAAFARAPWHALAPAMPVPAGGMTVERVPQMRRLFGPDTMFLIGGSLLLADDLAARCAAFVEAVAAEEEMRHA